jgi:3-oxoacyl-[acyl-carrier protein] reductase
MDFNNKTVMVTGSGNGIGRAIALNFARVGAANIILLEIDIEAANKVKAEIEQLGAKAFVYYADVSQADDVKGVFTSVNELFGPLDVLVNNVGTTIRKPIMEFNEEEWDYVFNTCVKSMYLCSVEAGKLMLKRKKGAVLNISSIHGLGGISGRLPYATSKTAVNSFTQTLACEWAQDGIRVNAIAPGYILTDGLKQAFSSGALNEVDMVTRTPMGRLGTPEEIADTAIYLCSNLASFITGSVLYVDGGYGAYHGPEVATSLEHNL